MNRIPDGEGVIDIIMHDSADPRVSELERLLGERTADLEAARQEMVSLLYSISHDLQAPLRRIEGFAKILDDDFADRLGPEGRQHLARITGATGDMGRLLGGLLGLSRVSRAGLRRVLTDLGALAAVIAAELRLSRPERRVTFVMAQELTAVADPDLMRVALEQLLGNAWHFTGKHPDARIEFGAQRGGGETVFFVRDDGAGFDMAYAQKLFVPFQRLHRADEFEGIGLGLATAQRIIRRHGGRIWAESAPEQGATFFFTVPDTAAPP